MAQLALSSGCCDVTTVTSALIGASKVSQIEDSVGAADNLTLSAELHAIDELCAIEADILPRAGAPGRRTPRERFIAALDGGTPVGRVPHFELVFFLTMEAFGKVHPSHRSYHQWNQMEEKETPTAPRGYGRPLHRHRRTLRARRHLPAPEPGQRGRDPAPDRPGARENGRPLLPDDPRRRHLQHPRRRRYGGVLLSHGRRSRRPEARGRRRA